MIIQLPQDVEDSVLEEVRRGHFSSADDALTKAWRAFLRQQEATRTPAEATSIDDQRRQNLARLCEEMDSLPTAPPADPLTNRDHDLILYGQ